MTRSNVSHVSSSRARDISGCGEEETREREEHLGLPGEQWVLGLPPRARLVPPQLSKLVWHPVVGYRPQQAVNGEPRRAAQLQHRKLETVSAHRSCSLNQVRRVVGDERYDAMLAGVRPELDLVGVRAADGGKAGHACADYGMRQPRP